MQSSSHFTGSIWFVTIIAPLVSLGAQIWIGSITPVTVLDWLDNESRQGPIVLIAGETSFWRGQALIRALSFGIGALVACLLANSQTWYLTGSLVVIASLCTVFAQLPRPATPMQLAVWAASAPIAMLAVCTFFRAWKGDA